MAFRTLGLGALVALVVAGCANAAPDSGEGQAAQQGAADTAAASLSPAYFDTDLPAESFFRRANPDPSKIDIAKLDALLAQAAALDSDSILIAQDDVIIVEKYFGKGNTKASVQSVTKSVDSLAVGALIDEGRIPSVDVAVSRFYPEWANDPQKATATLRELLTMTGGVVDNDAFWTQSDYLAYARSQPLGYAPGTQYQYSNESAMLFSGIVEQAAGMPIDKFVTQHFFTPLGITDAFWDKDSAGHPETPGGLFFTTLDMLRIGVLGEHQGVWNGQRLLSESWMTESTKNQTPLEACYGYLWWMVRPGCNGVDFGVASTSSPVQGFFADGWGGNFIAVIPSSHIVAVRRKLPADTASPEEVARTWYEGFTQDAAGLGRAP
jgi:CubicO group peptidase (beta-lactamase class C family)